MGKVAGNWEEDAGTSILEYFIFSYVSYIVMLVLCLFFMYFLRIFKGTEKEELIFDDADIHERLTGRSLRLNKWSVKFEDALVEKYYQNFVREIILPKINLFFLIIFSAFAVVKATRLFIDDPNPYPHLFSTMPRSRILETVSAMVHCAIFQWFAWNLESPKAWEKFFHGGGCGQKCCPKKCGSKGMYRTILVRDVIQLTRFFLFAAPYLLQVPAAHLCITDGNFLPSAQCQHIYWASHAKTRVTDNRMNPAYKHFLNDRDLEEAHIAMVNKIYAHQKSRYMLNESFYKSKDIDIDTFLFNPDLPLEKYTTHKKGRNLVRYGLMRNIFVEQSVRPWAYARDIELMTVYTFTLLLGYTLSQMATFDAGLIYPCSKESLGFGFFVGMNLWAFIWAFFLQNTIPWTTLTEILLRPALYWICFIYFVYFIEHSRRESWSRSIQIERHLQIKKKLHNVYQEKQERFVNDLAHNYGNMSSTVVLCWNEALAANENMMDAKEKGNVDHIFQMQKAMERSVRKAKALVVMTQTVVLASVRHLRGNIENRPTRVAVGEALRNIPYFTSQFIRFAVEIDQSVPEFVYIDYSVFLTCTINLASNAQKYSRGKIILRASYTNRIVTISVIDEGDGIPVDQQQVVFTRGQKSRLNSNGALENVQGEGIGLHSVATLVSSVGGRFGLISPWTNGRGSNFWFELTDESYKFSESVVKDKHIATKSLKSLAVRNAKISGISQKDDATDNSNDRSLIAPINEELKCRSKSEEEEIMHRMSDEYSLEAKIQSSNSDGVWSNVALITIGKEKMPYEFDDVNTKSFRMLIVEDNPLMVYAIKRRLGAYFREAGIPAILYVVDFTDPSSMGIITLELMKSDYVFDAILLDQQLGVRDQTKNHLWGTDVINLYNDYLHSDNLLEGNKEQMLHLMSAAGSQNILRRELTIKVKETDWLSSSPFSKPIQQRELDSFDVSIYPRYRKANEKSPE